MGAQQATPAAAAAESTLPGGGFRPYLIEAKQADIEVNPIFAPQEQRTLDRLRRHRNEHKSHTDRSSTLTTAPSTPTGTPPSSAGHDSHIQSSNRAGIAGGQHRHSKSAGERSTGRHQRSSEPCSPARSWTPSHTKRASAPSPTRTSISTISQRRSIRKLFPSITEMRSQPPNPTADMFSSAAYGVGERRVGQHGRRSTSPAFSAQRARS
eukprot:TRINITY_DN4832_c0_g1_i1.p1 TRINITY_DN4832_c0_g1~~TRINITY_DN4832_c0_g1_i1.p1  ORF type:complete len:229 (+),score=10.57 TRINITY_DN4832_c0_g1_i1:58-687(+)